MSTTTTYTGVRIVDMPDLGAFTASSSVVGERAGSGRFNAASLRQYVGSSSIVNVLDFGARGDGTTDDSVAIQGVIDSYAGKAIVYIPASSAPYSIASHGLILKTNLHLIVDAGATLRIADGAKVTCFVFPTNANDSSTDPPAVTSGVLIELFGTLDGNKANQGSPTDHTNVSAGITTRTGSAITNFFMRGNRQGLILNFKEWGINLQAATNCEVSGVTVDGCGASSEFAGTVARPCYDVGFSDCIFRNISDVGPLMYGGVYRGYLRNCDVTNCFSGPAIYTDGAHVAPCYDCEISGCTSYANTGAGIFVGGYTGTGGGPHQNTVVRDNHVYGNTRGGIFIGLADGVLVSDNYIHENQWIPVTDPAVTTLSGEIALNQSATRVSIVNNVIRDPQVLPAGNAGPAYTDIAVVSGAYAADVSGGVGGPTPAFSFTTAVAHGLQAGHKVIIHDLAGAGNVGMLNGFHSVIVGSAGGTTLNVAPAADTSMVVTGGTITARFGVGISFASSPYLYISGNRISDFKATKTMYAALGGEWGPFGLATNNYYGPRISATGFFPADPTVYDQASAQGINYDTVTGWVSNTTPPQPAGNTPTSLPARGLTVTHNFAIAPLTSGPGLGEVSFLVGQGAGHPGGFNFFQVSQAGTVNASVGIAGSLLANDGFGNTRLGGALVHGALQSYSLVNDGTVTIQPNTSFVLVQNSTSIAAGTVVLPDPGTGFAYPVPAVGGNNELEINFQNPVGALTVKAGGTLTVSGAPTTITAAGTSINFLQHGSTWLRRIMA